MNPVRAKHLVPNAVTLANIAFGFLGIVAAAHGQFHRSCVLLFCAALCDMMDGRLARMLDASSKFGMELDSLSDAISFGIAPGVLVYFAVLEKLGWIGTAVAVAYVLCAVLRLARFNMDETALGKVTFLGCPTPIAAGYLLSFTLVRDFMPAWSLALGVATTAACMVSTLKVPKFRKGGGLPFAMLLVGMFLFIGFLYTPGRLTWHLWNGWNWVMIAANYVYLSRGGHLRAKGHELRRAA